MNHKVVVNGVEFNFQWKQDDFSARQMHMYCKDVWLGSVEILNRKYECRFMDVYLDDKRSIMSAQNSVVDAAKEWFSRLDFKVAK